MASPYYNPKDAYLKKRKARFTFSEVHILLGEIRKNRHIVVGEFNHGISAELKKRTWAEITARVNEIGECDREVTDIIKKWSDLKCDTKKKAEAFREGSTVAYRHARAFTELSPTENIVLQILGPDSNQGGRPSPGSSGAQAEDDDDEDDDDVVSGFQGSFHSPSGGPRTLLGQMGLPGESPQASYEMQYDVPHAEDPRSRFMDSDDAHHDDPLLSSSLANSSNSLAEDNGPLIGHNGTSRSTSARGSASGPAVPPCIPLPASLADPREHLVQSATRSVQEQHTTNALLETVSRSLELMAESVQQLAETQQEFVRESLQLQRETLQVLRDFASGALAVMHDKVNGRPAAIL